MEVIINGDAMSLSKDVTTITKLIQHMEIENPVVIVELNGKILKQEDHMKSEVKQGDCIELIQFVGGG